MIKLTVDFLKDYDEQSEEVKEALSERDYNVVQLTLILQSDLDFI